MASSIVKLLKSSAESAVFLMSHAYRLSSLTLKSQHYLQEALTDPILSVKTEERVRTWTCLAVVFTGAGYYTPASPFTTLDHVVFLCRIRWYWPGDSTGCSPWLHRLSLCCAVQPRRTSEGCSAPKSPSPCHCDRACDGVQLCGPCWHRCHLSRKNTFICR